MFLFLWAIRSQHSGEVVILGATPMMRGHSLLLAAHTHLEKSSVYFGRGLLILSSSDSLTSTIGHVLGGEADFVMPSTFITQPDCGVYQLFRHWQSSELIGASDKDSYYPMLFWQLVLISGICQPPLRFTGAVGESWVNRLQTVADFLPWQPPPR